MTRHETYRQVDIATSLGHNSTQTLNAAAIRVQRCCVRFPDVTPQDYLKAI